ncbi:MAG: hypothetical protein GTN62_15400 [Gemmatimonadales bacterium]|nr:hypothetical protein [Gemmatimonadales bacterium]NIN13197.1 hypothetical protein [Gemmatimonadales bacterium]NIN51475.1 hypothetical protein [Gemmatimonadales bacterium]NIP08939.1 hypothetical protein [Gemmatimonadales bacterium]NIR03727.1 hypothetical protein [Gemmatimonadales bacterium]
MVFLQMLITVIYYCLIAYVAVILIWNLVKTRQWQHEVLYAIVLLPFVLRLLRLK